MLTRHFTKDLGATGAKEALVLCMKLSYLDLQRRVLFCAPVTTHVEQDVLAAAQVLFNLNRK